jgi:hypothetical protein
MARFSCHICYPHMVSDRWPDQWEQRLHRATSTAFRRVAREHPSMDWDRWFPVMLAPNRPGHRTALARDALPHVAYNRPCL